MISTSFSEGKASAMGGTNPFPLEIYIIIFLILAISLFVYDYIRTHIIFKTDRF